MTVSTMTVLLFVQIRNFLYSQISVFDCLCTLQIPLLNKHSKVFHQRSAFWDQYLHSKACFLIFCPRRGEISGCKIKEEKTRMITLKQSPLYFYKIMQKTLNIWTLLLNDWKWVNSMSDNILEIKHLYTIW